MGSVGVRTVLRGVGKTFIFLGVLILLFVAYQLWGTGLAESHAQDHLKHEFASATTTRPPTTATTEPSPAIGSASSTTSLPAGAPPTGAAIAILRIPKIHVDAAVVQGVGVSDLQKGPGHYPNSPMPGQAGNAAIAGHRTTYGAPFYDLNELETGDDIYVTTKESAEPWHYQVISSQSVSPNNVAVLNPTPDARLTLTTCTPRFSASQRLVVVARLIGQDPKPVVLPTVRGTVSTDLAAPDVGSLSGQSTTVVPAVAWGAVCAAILLGGWAGGRRWRRWPAYLIATPLFLLCLFFFFQNFARFVPANI